MKEKNMNKKNYFLSLLLASVLCQGNTQAISAKTIKKEHAKGAGLGLVSASGALAGLYCLNESWKDLSDYYSCGYHDMPWDDSISGKYAKSGIRGLGIASVATAIAYKAAQKARTYFDPAEIEVAKNAINSLHDNKYVNKAKGVALGLSALSAAKATESFVKLVLENEKLEYQNTSLVAAGATAFISYKSALKSYEYFNK
jgi:hypothetical protein